MEPTKTAAVPGTFDGTRYKDLRVLIPKPIREYYTSRGEWDLIRAYRSYEYSEVITVQGRYGLIRHRWGQDRQTRIWDIVDDQIVDVAR